MQSHAQHSAGNLLFPQRNVICEKNVLIWYWMKLLQSWIWKSQLTENGRKTRQLCFLEIRASDRWISRKKSFKMSLLEAIKSAAVMFSMMQTCYCSSGCFHCNKTFLEGLEQAAQQSCIQQVLYISASTSISESNPSSGPYNSAFKSSFGACNVLRWDLTFVQTSWCVTLLS